VERTPSHWLARARREPLVVFLLIGVAIFGVDRALASERGSTDPHRIVIDGAFVEGLRARHRESTGHAAEDDEALIREHVREEALYREALAAGLDAGDAIVRRRLVQKVELLVAASVEVPEPSEAELEAWRVAHEEALRTPARTRFTHVFFSRDRRGTEAVSDARAALPLGDAASGDPFLRGSSIGPATGAQIDAALGDGSAEAIAALPIGEWAGPIEGAYGAHLVRVDARDPARVPSLEAIRDRARAAWIEERREEATDRELARIVASYEAVRE